MLLPLRDSSENHSTPKTTDEVNQFICPPLGGFFFVIRFFMSFYEHIMLFIRPAPRMLQKLAMSGYGGVTDRQTTICAQFSVGIFGYRYEKFV